MKNSLRPVPCILGFGAGGHSKVVMEIIHRAGFWQIVGLLDSDPAKKGNFICGVEVLGSDDLAESIFQQGICSAFVGVGSVGVTQSRRKIYSMLLKVGFDMPVLVHPSASVAYDVLIGKATCIMPSAVVNPGTVIGECVIINSAAVVEHDCKIHDFAHISPRAVLAGDVTVGDGAHIGVGAVIRQGIRIGSNATIGAGAVVVKDVADGVTVVGVPAKPICLNK